MNTLRDAFARRADEAGTPDLDIDTLVGLGEARLRRRRASSVLGAGAIAALVVIGVVLSGSQTHRTTQQPVSPVRGGEVIAPHPYLWWMASDWHGVRQMGATPNRLPGCGDEPRSTWGAVASQVAVYANPNHPGRWFNEYLLQYPNASSAHHAFLDAWHHMKTCPQPNHGRGVRTGNGTLDRTIYNTGGCYDQEFSWLRVPPNNHHLYYARGVARVGNVLLVLDNSVWNDDGRIAVILSQAVEQALPRYYWSHPCVAPMA
jgi:hypothetical protein